MAELNSGNERNDDERSRKIGALPGEFRPMFWSGLDGRTTAVKETLRRYEKLRQDAGSNSTQKDLLCQRATFLGIKLETMEREALEGGPFDAGLYISLANGLTGVLRLLGIEKRARVTALKDYVEARTTKQSSS